MNRERIEEAIQWAKDFLDDQSDPETAYKPDDKIINRASLHEALCTLALRGLSDRSLVPKVVWREVLPDDWETYCLRAWDNSLGDGDPSRYGWRVEIGATILAEGFSASLEAAQKAADDALAKLVGGEG